MPTDSLTRLSESGCSSSPSFTSTFDTTFSNPPNKKPKPRPIAVAGLLTEPQERTLLCSSLSSALPATSDCVRWFGIARTLASPSGGTLLPRPMPSSRARAPLAACHLPLVPSPFTTTDKKALHRFRQRALAIVSAGPLTHPWRLRRSLERRGSRAGRGRIGCRRHWWRRRRGSCFRLRPRAGRFPFP